MENSESTSIGAVKRTRIVVPAYNEAERLDVATLDGYLSHNDSVDFVLVNDGSSDGTLALLNAQAAKWPHRVQVVDLQPNRGKSEAVRQGVLAALAREDTAYVGYWDADWATPLATLDRFIACLDRDPNVHFVMGSRVRLLGRHIDRKASRHYVGRVAATMASLVLGIPVYDTQCGAKLLRVRSDMPRLFATPFASRWVFDVELIARYLERAPNGVGIYEVPLEEWRDVGDSKVQTRDVFRAFWDMLLIYHRYPHQSRR